MTELIKYVNRNLLQFKKYIFLAHFACRNSKLRYFFRVIKMAYAHLFTLKHFIYSFRTLWLWIKAFSLSYYSSSSYIIRNYRFFLSLSQVRFIFFYTKRQYSFLSCDKFVFEFFAGIFFAWENPIYLSICFYVDTINESDSAACTSTQ